MAAYASASALPVFTLSPSGAGLAGQNVTADNFVVSDYSTVKFGASSTAGTAFTENGFLNVQSFQLGSSPAVGGTGLNSTFGLYFDFIGAGMQSSGNPTTTATSGALTSLDYKMYGYSRTASYGFDGSNNATVSTTGSKVLLATGSLIGTGFVNSNPSNGSFFAGAGANLTFNPESSASGFFVDPQPFYNMAITAFINTPSQVSPFAGGFTISQGGGSVNFASPVPEPETYALMLAGLGAIGWISRRRRKA